MKRVVLDSSAVLMFFDGRPGAEKVERLLAEAVQGKRELFMSVVNWGEVYYSVWRTKGSQAAERVLAEIAQLPIQIIDADSELTQRAAALRAQHKLPYADCFAAALAQHRKAMLATADQDFAQVEKEIRIVWATDQ